MTSYDPVFEVKYEVSRQFKVQIWTQRPEITQSESISPHYVIKDAFIYHVFQRSVPCNDAHATLHCLYLQLCQSTTVEKTIVPQVCIQNFNAFVVMVWIL